MKSFDSLQEEPLKKLLQKFTYRPGWTFEVEAGTLIVRAIVIDTDDPTRTTPLSFAQIIPQYVPDDFDWTRWLLRKIMEIEDHEAREFFKIDGVKVFDPHG